MLKGIILVFASFMLDCAAGYFGSSFTQKPIVIRSDCAGKFKYLNPSLDCSYSPVINKKLYGEFVDELDKFIEEEIKDGRLTSASIYFRDLVQGPTFGINENDFFTPASLLKVPMMITYFDLSDKDATLLRKKTFYKEVTNEVVPQIKPDEEIKINTQYSIDELIEKMIVFSDNLAFGLLDKTLITLYPDNNVYLRTMQGLGLVNPGNTSQGTFTVKTYSSMFRQLYNGSYLSLESSEKALSLLARAKFSNGLAAGVPKGIKIAHKFGERKIPETNEQQFHDCGIVYFPNNPYLICIMTKGTDLQTLISTVAKISEMTYKEIESRKI